MEKKTEKQEKFLENKVVTDEELKRLRETLPKNQRLVEVSPNHYKILTRLQE